MKLLLPTCLGLAAVANAWTGDNCKRFADIYTDGADLINRMWGSMVEVNPCGSVWAALHTAQLGSCASSGHVWRLRTARHSQYEASPQSAQPLPRLLELAASKAAAFDHPGDTNPSPGPGRALTLALALSLTLTLTLALTLPLTRWGDSFRYEVKTIMMEN